MTERILTINNIFDFSSWHIFYAIAHFYLCQYHILSLIDSSGLLTDTADTFDTLFDLLVK